MVDDSYHEESQPQDDRQSGVSVNLSSPPSAQIDNDSLPTGQIESLSAHISLPMRTASASTAFPLKGASVTLEVRRLGEFESGKAVSDSTRRFETTSEPTASDGPNVPRYADTPSVKSSGAQEASTPVEEPGSTFKSNSSPVALASVDGTVITKTTSTKVAGPSSNDDPQASQAVTARPNGSKIQKFVDANVTQEVADAQPRESKEQSNEPVTTPIVEASIRTIESTSGTLAAKATSTEVAGPSLNDDPRALEAAAARPNDSEIHTSVDSNLRQEVADAQPTESLEQTNEPATTPIVEASNQPIEPVARTTFTPAIAEQTRHSMPGTSSSTSLASKPSPYGAPDSSSLSRASTGDLLDASTPGADKSQFVSPSSDSAKTTASRDSAAPNNTSELGSLVPETRTSLSIPGPTALDAHVPSAEWAETNSPTGNLPNVPTNALTMTTVSIPSDSTIRQGWPNQKQVPVVPTEVKSRIDDAPSSVKVTESQPLRSVQEVASVVDSGRTANLTVQLADGQTAHATVRERAGSVDVKIVTSTSATAERVSSEIDGMRRNLDAAGLQLGRSEVSYQPSGGGGRGREEHQRERPENQSSKEMFTLSEVAE